MRKIRFALLVACLPAALQAQWRISLLHGTAATHGDAQADADPDHPELRADRPTTWTVSLSHDAPAWRIGLELHHTTADLAEAGASSRIATSGVLSASGAAIELSRRIAGDPSRTSLLAGAGGSVDRWRFDLGDGSPRTRIAVRCFLELNFAMGPGWSGVVRGAVSTGPSVFKADELPEGFSTRTAVRSGLAVGVAKVFR